MRDRTDGLYSTNTYHLEPITYVLIPQLRKKRSNTVEELLRLLEPGKVPGVFYDQQFRIRDFALQILGRGWRTNEVITSDDNEGWNLHDGQESGQIHR